MSIQLIILNYRTAALAVACLESLAGEIASNRDRNVVVVDSASTEVSARTIEGAIVERGWSDWARILPLKCNLGFAGGNNAAIRDALSDERPPDYFLLLNPDTTVKSGAIQLLVDFMDRNSHIGIAGSSLEDAEGRPQCSAHRFPSPFGELLGAARLGLLDRVMSGHAVSPLLVTQPTACDWVSGASMIIRREVFEEIGLLDEGYFLYFEEVDFCFRARKSGWEIWSVPQARVVHLEGAATGIGAKRKPRPTYWYDSRRRFLLKSYGVGGLLLADCLWAIGRLSWCLRRCLGLARPANDPSRFAWDLLVGDLQILMSGPPLRPVDVSS